MFLLLISLALISTTSSFLIIDAEPGLLVVEPGQRVNLSCVVDDHYEYCMWHSPTDSMCDFEWKRNKDNITMQECPLNQNQEKISFHGKYDDKQCGISFIATVEDTGVWRCEVEEYVWGGSRNSGRKVSATMTVTVQASTTNRPRTPPSTTTTTTSTTSSSTTSTTISSTKSTSSSPTTSTTPTTKAKSSAPVSNVTTKAVDGNSEGSQNTPEAVPRVDSESFDSAGASTAVVVILLVLGSVVGGALYYRRRRMKRPDATAAVVYEREAKDSRDTTNMMRNSNGSEVSGGITDLRTAQLENKNLHEFFPHSESFA